MGWIHFMLEGTGIRACLACGRLPVTLTAFQGTPCQQDDFPPRVTAAIGLGAALTKAGVQPSDLLTAVSWKRKWFRKPETKAVTSSDTCQVPAGGV